LRSFWKGLTLGVKALFTRPLKYLTDPVGATEDIYKAELEAAGYSSDDIVERIKEFEGTGGPVTSVFKGYGSATKAIGDAVEQAGGVLKFFGKNFAVVLIVALIIVGIWYFLMFRKATA
jgi:hypothetical protein